MRHTCQRCATAYEIPDDKVAGRFLKVRCQRCHTTMHVVGLRSLDARGENGAVWWCAIGKEPRGPYREDEVLSLVSAGDVHARSRMWCAGMNGWERVCESATLGWVYAEVCEQAAKDPMLLTMPSCVFDRAALLTDGKGYFPDPTLKSGIVILDEEVQRSLQRSFKSALRRGAAGTRAEEEPGLAAPLLAAAVGAAAAASGVLWFVLGQPV